MKRKNRPPDPRKIKSPLVAWKSYAQHAKTPMKNYAPIKEAFLAGAAWAASKAHQQTQIVLDAVKKEFGFE